MHLLSSAAAVLVAVVGAETGSSGDWPQWRGPHRDGISTETGLARKWPKDGPTLIWEAKGIGDGFSTVAVQGGRAYTQGNRGKEDVVIALDVEAAGKELWATPNGKAYKNSFGDGPRGTPTIDGKVLYALGGNGDLACLELETGKKVWSINILAEFKADNPGWGISESPLIVGEKLIVTPGGQDATIVALDKSSGKTIWKSQGLSDSAAYSSCITFQAAGVEQVANFTHKGIVGVALADGKPLWRYDRVANTVANIATPVHVDGHVFATSAYDTGCALVRLEPDGAGKVKAKEVYFSRELKNHHGGVVLVGEHIYGFSDSTLRCIEWKTGKDAWTHRSVGKGSLVFANGCLYILGEDGKVGLAEANPKEYRELSSFEVEHGKQKAWAHPVVAGGRLYIRTQDRLRCFDVADGARTRN